jgi:hypothetical protein
MLPAVREYCGYPTDWEAHRALKAGFYHMHPEDPRLPSMKRMTQEEASRFFLWVQMQAASMGLDIKDPGEAEAVA